MDLTLSSTETKQLRAALGVLLSPLDYQTLNDWRSAVSRSVLPLLKADGVLFMLQGHEPPTFFSEQVEPRALQQYAEYYMSRDVGHTRRKERRLEVWSRRMLFPDLDTLEQSECYNDWFVPHRYLDSIGVMIDSKLGPPVAGLYLSRQRFGTEDFGERGVALLHLLAPAFRAGVETYRGLGRSRAELLRLLDRMDVALGIYTLERRRLHASVSLEQVLDQEPDRRVLEHGMLETVRTLAARIRPPSRASITTQAPEEHVVRTRGANYRLRGSFLQRDLIPGASPLVLVQIDRLNSARPSAAELCERFGLTPREAGVALLLAERRSNEEVARALVISPHTARHHTERVLFKVGARARGEVAEKIALDGQPQPSRS